MPERDRVHRTVYRYGHLAAGHYGHVVLGLDGGVRYYRHENEAGFRLRDDVLNFFNRRGEVTGSLKYFAEANCALAAAGRGLYLLPELELGKAPAKGAMAPMLINSIPKSGTYFTEAALAGLGVRPLRLHLFARFCHDYRGLPDEALHRRPGELEISVPAGAIAHLMRPGEMIVGHIDEHGELDEFAAAGVRGLHCVRDLRDVLASLYRFKRARVEPVNAADLTWRALDGREGFMAFLGFYAERDIAHIAGMAALILARPEPRLRFEDAVRGDLPQELTEAFPELGLREGLRAAYGRPTSTFSGRRVCHTEFWSEAATRFFVDSGLDALNQGLGYPACAAERPQAWRPAAE